MTDNDLLARMRGLAGEDMGHFATYHCPITGCRYSAAFKSGRIVPNDTVLWAHRERGAISAVAGRAYQVREGDTQAVVLRLHDRGPSDVGLSHVDLDYYHGGYLAFGTDGRSAAAVLMDRTDICPHVKIMAVYSDTACNKWIHAGGRGSNGCNGRVYVFVRRDKLNELGPAVAGVLTAYGLN